MNQIHFLLLKYIKIKSSIWLSDIAFSTHPDRVAGGDLEVLARAVSAPGPGSRVVTGSGGQLQAAAAPGEAPRH